MMDSLSTDLPSIDLRRESTRAKSLCLARIRNPRCRRNWKHSFVLQAATPHERTRFLVWKDRNEKNEVHAAKCPLFGMHSKHRCSGRRGPSRLAARSVDSTTGKLIAIFNNAGRNGPDLERSLRHRKSCNRQVYPGILAFCSHGTVCCTRFPEAIENVSFLIS